MFEDPLGQIGSHADIQDRMRFIGKEVNKTGFHVSKVGIINGDCFSGLKKHRLLSILNAASQRPNSRHCEEGGKTDEAIWATGAQVLIDTRLLQRLERQLLNKQVMQILKTEPKFTIHQ